MNVGGKLFDRLARFGTLRSNPPVLHSNSPNQTFNHCGTLAQRCASSTLAHTVVCQPMAARWAAIKRAGCLCRLGWMLSTTSRPSTGKPIQGGAGRPGAPLQEQPRAQRLGAAHRDHQLTCVAGHYAPRRCIAAAVRLPCWWPCPAAPPRGRRLRNSAMHARISAAAHNAHARS